MKVTHEPITKIICYHIEIKLGQFTQEELDSVLRKIKKIGKPQGLTKYPQEYGRPGYSTTYYPDTVMPYKIETIGR